ncbi:MAG: hypothetical protein ACKOEE_00725 [Tagaea sp.]
MNSAPATILDLAMLVALCVAIMAGVPVVFVLTGTAVLSACWES